MKESDFIKNKPNRLMNQKSPYLLQHANNPVDWFPWGEEAFKKAHIENKPIFLSIGYSTCHWCHVMEKESFEDDEVAGFLNENFVSIKVDREERPDIDHIYMTVCQMLTGSGGWPLTIIMNPDKEPFFAGTYFPKNDRMGMQGLLSILQHVKEAWVDQPEILTRSGNQITKILSQSEDSPERIPFQNLIHDAYTEFQNDFDDQFGGFGRAPKFPSPHNLFFLLRYWYQTKQESALLMVESTLDAMYKGGIFDHIGFGFSRYSTDKMWLVPHFEKMLYDNALLSIAYLETFQITENKKYADIAKQIFSYILRDMTSPEGGFYSAEDADSEGEEGKFYLWTVDEIKDSIGNEDGGRFCSYFNISKDGNFEGKNIPNLINPNLTVPDGEFINHNRKKLFDIREKRIHPYKDDKILTSWNGLMIAALAIGGRVLGSEEYAKAAENAVSFVLKNLIRDDGRLLARYREGEAAFPAYVDDYAFFIWGLIELYETTFKPEYLEKAIKLNKNLIQYFWDNKKGGLFVYGSDSEQLIARPKEAYDGAMPSGNSVSALNFLRLARLTGLYELEDKANEIFQAFGGSIKKYPKGYSFALMSMMYASSVSKEIVVVADQKNKETQNVINIINQNFNPFTITVLYTNDKPGIENLIPYIADYETFEGKPTVFICENQSCKKPITDLKALKDTLKP